MCRYSTELKALLWNYIYITFKCRKYRHAPEDNGILAKTRDDMQDKQTANLSGYAAITLWSFSAVFIQWTAEIPPLLLAGLTSAGGFLFFGAQWLRDPQKLRACLKQSWQVWLLFFCAVVIYRGFYLCGLKLAPIIEANLLNYLWPLLIIVFSGLIDKKKIPPLVYAGSVACFAGVICIGLSKSGGRLDFHPGHVFAFIAACVWAAYSVATRRYPGALSDMIGVMHLVALGVFVAAHLAVEQRVDYASVGMLNWVGTAGLALAVSLGYKLWDRAMTHGDRERVATAAYFTPLLSTFWLIIVAGQGMAPLVWVAAVLILGGSTLSCFATREKKTPKLAEPD
jgi:drug/metabolite transporter (DMT)-like permease